jgi:ABC-2 type transport system permease protein
MRGASTLIRTQFVLFLREPIALFFTLAFPSMLLVIFGAIYGNEPVPEFFGHSFGTVDASVPAYAAIIIGTVALMSIPIDMAGNRDAGVLRRYRVTPLRPVVYVASSAAVYFGVGLLGMAILVLVGRLGFNLHLAGAWIDVVAGFTLCSLAFYAIGFVLASVAPTARLAQTVGMVLFFPMMFLSGAGMPLQMLPEGVRRISDLLPLTYVVELMQGLWFGEGWQAHLAAVAVLTGMLIAGVALSARFFRWE